MSYRNNVGEITDTAMAVLKKRYFQPGEDPGMMFSRVACAVANNMEEQRDFYWMMRSLDFLPNSPTLMNAGTGQGTLSACFVLPVADSMQGITHASHTQAMVQKFGGGTGFSLSGIRPKGDPIATTHGKACGPVAVLKYLSATSTLVTQGGKRDGANMAVLRVDHPDIMEFINCKQTEGDIHNFNISVGIDGMFIHSVEDDLLIYPSFDGKQYGEIPARDIWKAITENAHRNGEPGLVFLDRINHEHPGGDAFGRIEATNPCGEQPLLPYESCNLGSINLLNFVNRFNNGFDFEQLGETVALATRFLDNTIDTNEYATDEVKTANMLTRKIGLGVMGWADALSRMRIPYDSVEATKLGAEVMKFIAERAERTSKILGREKGCYAGWASGKGLPKRRNLCLTSIAPTGSISMIAGVSSGIEPHFALVWRKQNILEGESFDFVNQEFLKALEGQEAKEWAIGDARDGLLQKCLNLPETIRLAFLTASDISPIAHVKMQAAFQDHVDSGVSKTINLPNEATVEDVATIYADAYAEGCKGITIYRQGSREKEVLVTASDKPVSHSGYHRPQTLEGATVRITTGRGKAYITLNELGGELREVLVVHGKAGGNDAAMAQALSRLIGVSLQHGVAPDEIYKQLIGITDIPVWDSGKQILSLPDGIGQAIKEWYAPVDEFLGVIEDEYESIYEARGVDCIDCGNQLAMVEGCMKCLSCGYSQC